MYASLQAIISALAANANILTRLLQRSRQLAARAAAAEQQAAEPGSGLDQVKSGWYRAEQAALAKQLAVQRELPTYHGSVEVLLLGAEGLLRAKLAG